MKDFYGYQVTGFIPVTKWRRPAKSRLAIARQYQRLIAKLQREREKLYAKALRELKMQDTNLAFDWFFNDQQGKSEFLGVIGK